MKKELLPTAQMPKQPFKPFVHWHTVVQYVGVCVRQGWRFWSVYHYLPDEGRWQCGGFATPDSAADMAAVLETHQHQVIGHAKNENAARKRCEKFLRTAPVPKDTCGCQEIGSDA